MDISGVMSEGLETSGHLGHFLKIIGQMCVDTSGGSNWARGLHVWHPRIQLFVQPGLSSSNRVVKFPVLCSSLCLSVHVFYIWGIEWTAIQFVTDGSTLN